MKLMIAFLAVFILSACSLISPPAPVSISIVTPTQPVSPTASTTPSPSPTPYELPNSVVPEGLGVNINFFTAPPEELDLLTSAGFKFVRMDLAWEAIEQVKGEYYFDDFDHLVEFSQANEIRILFILDYGNPLYDGGLAPYTDEGRAAFAQYAVASAKHFANKGILWEIWNEPNIAQFWKPQPSPEDYAKLALTTIEAIRSVDPNAFIIGPALCCVENDYSWSYMEYLGKAGVLNKFDAITIHPYQQDMPEIASKYYIRLRKLLETYSPDRELPVYSGEWGYSTSWANQDEMRQADYLTRSWLVNLSNNINLSIWYSWKDACTNKVDAQCNFGVVDINLQPKPAYLAAKNLTQLLDGYQFERRIPAENAEDYLLVFSKNEESILVVWTVGQMHPISLPLQEENLVVVSMLGERSELLPVQNVFTVDLSDSPKYLLVGSQIIP